MNRQLWRQLLPALYEFPIIVDNKAEFGTATDVCNHAACLPHEVFSSLYTAAPDLFRHLFTGEPGNLAQWWAEADECDPDWCRSHPTVTTQPDPEKRVPLGMHGDDAGMAGLESVLAITWGSIASDQRSTLDTRIAFSMVKTREIFGTVTMDTLYGIFAWSFKALATGKFPYEDHEGTLFSLTHHPDRFARRGQYLAGGFVGCWAEMRGDWKFLKEALRLKNHYNCQSTICHLCLTLKDIANLGMRYTNFRRDALHRQTLITNDEFMASYGRMAFMSLLLTIPGFTIWRVYFDYMHTHDLGVTQLWVPSVMKEMTERRSDVFVGNNRQEKLASAYRLYRRWCKDQRVKSVIDNKFTSSILVCR